jgi:hypothetical protein
MKKLLTRVRDWDNTQLKLKYLMFKILLGALLYSFTIFIVALTLCFVGVYNITSLFIGEAFGIASLVMLF